MPQQLRVYQQQDGVRPFTLWLAELKDRQARARIQTRLDRLALGNVGDCRTLNSGVSELRIDWGPGYRVYFGRIGELILLLLCGGDKTTQQQDIERAKAYFNDYRARTARPKATKPSRKSRKRPV